MLYLTRKMGDSVVIDDNIEVTVVEIRGKSVKLGITFPPEVTVRRRELYDRIQAEKPRRRRFRRRLRGELRDLGAGRSGQDLIAAPRGGRRQSGRVKRAGRRRSSPGA